jgi:dUTP pyrophosphatase
MKLAATKLRPTAKMPEFASVQDSGADVFANFDIPVEELIKLFKSSDPMRHIVFDGPDQSNVSAILIEPGQRMLVPTGLRLLPDQTCIDIDYVPHQMGFQVRSKSGLAWKQGIVILNSPGTIDCGYQGELMAIVLNTSSTPVYIQNGQKIAQIVVELIPMMGDYHEIPLEEVPQYSTSRGEGGMGSTGV